MLQEKTVKKTKFKLTINCWLSIHNINTWRLRITGKNALYNLINPQLDIVKIYLCARNPYEAKYQLLIIKSKSIGSKHCNALKAYIEYPNDIENVYNNIDDYHQN